MREFAAWRACPDIGRKLQSSERLIRIDRHILELGHHSHTAQS
jgi:hypothetical protein